MTSINKKNVLVVRWGSLRIHDYYFATMLRSCGFEVAFAIYTPHYAYRDSISKEIRENVLAHFEVIEESYSFVSRQLLRLAGLIERTTGVVLQSLFMNAIAAQRLSKLVATRSFTHVIPIEHGSLHLANTAIPRSSKKFLYYSLEINLLSDPGLSKQFRNLLQFEQSMLSNRIRALFIQDKFRAEALLGKPLNDSTLSACYIPVSVPGPAKPWRGIYFNERMKIPMDKTIVLYFGAVYGDERKLGKLIDVMNRLSDDQCVMVLHGSREFRALLPNDTTRIRISEALVPFEQLDEILQSCDIGIALYDNACLNTRLTAFSSEKITRYLQCGKPFIAFRNESTAELRRQYLCCELIDDIEELAEAIATIQGNHEKYSEACINAFNAIYSQSKITRKLLAFFDDLEAPQELKK